MSPAAGAARPAKKAARKAPATPERARPTRAPRARGPQRPSNVASAPSAGSAVPPAWTVVPDSTPIDVAVPVVGAREPFWGANDGPHMPRWTPDRFFPAPAPPPAVPFAVRSAAAPLRLAGVFAVLGFFAVFVQQASLALQIVIGAPVFEEMVKFGLALLVVGAIPRGGRLFPLVAVLRVAVAWAVGAGFGWLEHLVTYPDEPVEVYAGRVLFHGGATALSMAMYCAVEGAADVRLRWFATAPATLLHYANNVGAVALLVAPDGGLAWAAGITAAVYVALVAGPASLRWWRPLAEAWALRRWPLHPPAVPEDWDEAQAQAAATAPPGPAPGPTSRPRQDDAWP